MYNFVEYYIKNYLHKHREKGLFQLINGAPLIILHIIRTLNLKYNNNKIIY